MTREIEGKGGGGVGMKTRHWVWGNGIIICFMDEIYDYYKWQCVGRQNLPYSINPTCTCGNLEYPIFYQVPNFHYVINMYLHCLVVH